MAMYSASYRQSKALIVGIDSYSDTSLNILGNAESDARSLSTLLAGLRLPFDVDLVLGKDATRDSILTRLHRLRSSDREDRILFYFAGHGFFGSNQFGTETGFIVANDTEVAKDFTAINLSEVLNLRLNTPAKHIGYIFDSCFSGQALGLSTRGPRIAQDKFLERRAYQVITAGAGDQVVSDVASLTQSLIDAVNRGLAEQNSMVTFSSLGLYLKNRLASQKNQSQVPQFGHLEGSQGGEIVISAAQAYMSLSPPSTSASPSTASREERPSLPIGQSTADIDIVGRIDDMSIPTAVTIYAGLHFSLLMPPNEKKQALQTLSELKPRWGALRRKLLFYSLLLFYIVRDHVAKLEKINIDNEYQGHEPFVKGLLFQLLRGVGVPVRKQQVEFVSLPRDSQARTTSSRVYKGESIPDWVVTADEILLPINK